MAGITRFVGPRRVAAATIGTAAGLALALPAIGAVTGNGTAGGPVPGHRDAEVQAYRPNVITIRAGDSVRFTIQGFHTVTFLPKGGKIPAFVAPTGQNAAPANDPAGVPYWWGAAGVPQFGFNAAAPAPSRSLVVTGRRLANSGFPNPRKPVVTFRFPTAGTYEYRCFPHPEMRGIVRVLPRTAKAPSAAAQARRAAAELKRDQSAARAAIAKAAKGPFGTTVKVGVGSRRFAALRFFPESLTVRAGTVVNFEWGGRSEIHTVTFGPEAQLTRLQTAFEAPSPFVPAEVQYPSDPPGAGPVAVTPTAHGVGLVNSGIIFDPGAGPAPHAFAAVFPVPGTYTYICVIHGALMKGTITVTP